MPASSRRRLTTAGIDVRSVNTRQGWINRSQLNFRNHRKLLVVDGERALVDGLNVGDEYLGHCNWVTRWRDTSVEAAGPIVKKIQAVFAADYYWASRQGLSEVEWKHAGQPGDENHADAKPTSSLRSRAALCATGPSDPRSRVTMMFAADTLAATQRIWISTPDLVPDETTLTCLSMARARGGRSHPDP